MKQTRNNLRNSFYKKNSYSLIFLPIILGIGIFILADRMDLPGPYVDDSRHMMFAQQFLENKDSFPYSFELFGKIFPLGKYYNGESGLYIFEIPLVYLFGPNLVTLRIYGIILMVLTTIFTYLFAKELFNQKIGIISSFLFALTPSTFLFTKYPSMVDTTMILFLLASFYFLLRWKNTKKTVYMVAAFLLLGLGFNEKVVFIWVFISLAVAYLIFKPSIDVTPKNIFLMACSIIIGSTFFILTWIINFKGFLNVVYSRLVNTPQGHTNIDFLTNLSSRYEQIFELLDGSRLSLSFGGSYSNDAYAMFFLISVIGIIIMSVIRKNPFFRRSAFLIIVFFVILSVSIFSLTTSNVASLIILLPLSAIIMAVFIDLFTKKIKMLKNGRKISNVFFYGILIFLLSGNILLINEYKAEAQKTGGTPNYSVLFSQAGKYLLENNYTRVTTLDVAFLATIYVSTEGKIDINQNILYDYQVERWLNNYKNNLQRNLNDQEMVYIKFNDKYNPTIRKNFHVIEEVLELENKQFITLKIFNNSKGENLISIYKAIDKN